MVKYELASRKDNGFDRQSNLNVPRDEWPEWPTCFMRLRQLTMGMIPMANVKAENDPGEATTVKQLLLRRTHMIMTRSHWGSWMILNVLCAVSEIKWRHRSVSKWMVSEEIMESGHPMLLEVPRASDESGSVLSNKSPVPDDGLMHRYLMDEAGGSDV